MAVDSLPNSVLVKKISKKPPAVGGFLRLQIATIYHNISYRHRRSHPQHASGARPSKHTVFPVKTYQIRAHKCSRTWIVIHQNRWRGLWWLKTTVTPESICLVAVATRGLADQKPIERERISCDILARSCTARRTTMHILPSADMQLNAKMHNQMQLHEA